jgi:hypothetical protein
MRVLRDQALFFGGILSPKMFGKPVRPPKPDMGLSTAFGSRNDWVTSTGEDRFRRALYTEVRRNSPYPSFATFDAPNREVCTLRRGRTNTPLQALALMNDPQFVEAARALGILVLKEGKDFDQRLDIITLRLLNRKLEAEERAAIQDTYTSAEKYYREKPEEAKLALTVGESTYDATLPTVDLAAWTLVANQLFNLDETVTR